MRITLFIISIFFSVSCFSQTDPNEIFRNLKEGAILVRLRTNENVLKAVKGKNKLEEKVKRHILIQNQGIIDAFSLKFTYCKVFYFYSNATGKIKDKEFAEVLYDKNLNKVVEIPKLDNNYLISTFQGTKIDTMDYWMWYEYRHQYYENNGQYSDTSGLSTYYGSPSMHSIDALILYSPDLIPLQDPYPHYVRTFERIPFIKRSRERSVELLQYKIEKYINQRLN
ncbi:MAG: hypothetical protein JEZ09_07920 [Salinivirgaceae bacterium]|nr:hypothetical protein [Salinivirgaceae bacterium]